MLESKQANISTTETSSMINSTLCLRCSGGLPETAPSLFTPQVWSQLETLRFSCISLLNPEYQIYHGLGLPLGCVIFEQSITWYVLLQCYVALGNSPHYLTSTNCGFRVLVRDSAWDKELWEPVLLDMQRKIPEYMRDLCFQCSSCFQW